jgi:hypothetical protein
MDTYEAAMDAHQWTQPSAGERQLPLWLLAMLLIAIAANVYAGDLRRQQQTQPQSAPVVQQP